MTSIQSQIDGMSKEQLAQALLVAVKALEELSCLGNGEIPGNSLGNEKAQNALSRIRSLHTT